MERSLSRWGHIPTADITESTTLLAKTLFKVPTLPARIPQSSKIGGFSTWSNEHTPCSFSTRKGSSETLKLTKPYHTICKISPSSNFRVWGTNGNNGIALLVAGWAYILTASLAERQQLSMEYNALTHFHRISSLRLELSYASDQEIRWWKAIVAPGSGWSIEGQRTSPWALSMEDFDVSVAGELASDYPPPLAEQAASYLHRFCCFFGLGRQSVAALSTTLSVPLQANINSRGPASITLPAPSFSAQVSHRNLHGLPPEMQHLGRYMTLSLSTSVFGALLWSIFWEPGIPCNFAGAWITPIRALLEPIIQNGELEDLVRATSGSHVSPLWLGIALCGRVTIVKRIVPFLKYLTAYPEFRPNSNAAGWTGLALSFMDFYRLQPPRNGTVTREDVWRLRFEFSEAYTDGHFTHLPLYPWQPFGRMEVGAVELEVRNHIECSHQWSYKHWTWDFNLETEYGTSVPPSCLTDYRYLRSTSNDSRVEAFAANPLTYETSKLATESIFGWSSTQVEEGFGVIVPRRFGRDEPAKVRKQTVVNEEAINEWVDEVARNTQ